MEMVRSGSLDGSSQPLRYSVRAEFVVCNHVGADVVTICTVFFRAGRSDMTGVSGCIAVGTHFSRAHGHVHAELLLTLLALLVVTRVDTRGRTSLLSFVAQPVLFGREWTIRGHCFFQTVSGRGETWKSTHNRLLSFLKLGGPIGVEPRATCQRAITNHP